MITIQNCASLKCLFSASIARQLMQLHSVLVWGCELIENIIQIGQEEGEEKTAYSFEWPSIEHINLWGCPELKTFGFKIQSLKTSRKMNVDLDPRSQEPRQLVSCSVQDSPVFLSRCIECVPRLRNSSLVALSDGGTTKESHGNSSLEEIGLNVQGRRLHCPINKEVSILLIYIWLILIAFLFLRIFKICPSQQNVLYVAVVLTILGISGRDPTVQNCTLKELIRSSN